jgi:hypothetical protein
MSWPLGCWLLWAMSVASATAIRCFLPGLGAHYAAIPQALLSWPHHQGRKQPGSLVADPILSARRRHPGPLGAFFRRLAKRKNRQVAIVAVARKLVSIAYLMLKNNEPYRYAKPKLVAEKFAALDRAAGGKTSKSRKRKPGPTAHARAGLAAVYAHAGLPKVTSPDNLPDGEQRMLKERKLTSFVGDLYEPASKPFATKPSTKKETGRPAGRPR